MIKLCRGEFFYGLWRTNLPVSNHSLYSMYILNRIMYKHIIKMSGRFTMSQMDQWENTGCLKNTN